MYIFNQDILVENTHRIKYRRRFETQKSCKNFKKWKTNRLKNQGYMCFYCHKAISVRSCHIDHLVPLHYGGGTKGTILS